MSRVDFTYPLNISFECNCCGLCCGDTETKTRHILLLESEAAAISSQTKLPIEQFAVRIWGKEPYVYEMKKPSEGKCFFLKDNRCTNYDLRPLICRFYPFELRFETDKDTHVFSVTTECPTVGTGKRLIKRDFEELYYLAQQRLG